MVYLFNTIYKISSVARFNNIVNYSEIDEIEYLNDRNRYYQYFCE